MADENELMLELSIGGIFAKPKPNPNGTKSMKNNDRIGQSNDGVRRRELRRKKGSGDYGSCGSVSGPFVENKEWLEAQIDGQNDEPVRKKERIEHMNGKVCSVLTVEEDNNFVFRPSACRSFRPYQGNMNLKPNENGCVSSAYSDGQFSPHQGVTSDDSRSNSSNSQLDQQPASTSTASVEPFDQPQPTGSSKPTVSTLTTKLTNSIVKPNPHESSVLTPPSKPEPSSQHEQASLLARMPCVSTTGNGPNGKTVSGFLYRYTKKEVSIVCVCHGRSFSPAGFVEHAGGVDVVQPLKHIIIYPDAFAY